MVKKNISRGFLLLLAIVVLGCSPKTAQHLSDTKTSTGEVSSNYKAVAIGFYNLENLFDTDHDEGSADYTFLPHGDRAWTDAKYREKLSNMAFVISKIATDIVPSGLSLLGVAEVENRGVLEDLLSQPSIADRHYGIVHYDSPDRRGIDVALLYNPAHFEVVRSRPVHVDLVTAEDTLYTRDILYVEGMLDGDRIHILVNHWPSRYGGLERSQPNRIKAAKTCLSIVDSLRQNDPKAKVIIMGDLNDDPVNESVVGILKAKGKKKEVGDMNVFNPMMDFYRRGLGSNAYRDNWSLFDQIMLSRALLDKNQDGYFFLKARVFNKKYLIQPSGQYKGYPFRTFAGDHFQGGYSDHFPVYIVLVKKL